MLNQSTFPDIIRVETFKITREEFRLSDVNARLAAGWVLLGVMIDRRILEGEAYYSFETYILGLPRTPENEKYAHEMLKQDGDLYTVTFETANDLEKGKTISLSTPQMSKKQTKEFLAALKGKKVLSIFKNGVQLEPKTYADLRN